MLKNSKPFILLIIFSCIFGLILLPSTQATCETHYSTGEVFALFRTYRTGGMAISIKADSHAFDTSPNVIFGEVWMRTYINPMLSGREYCVLDAHFLSYSVFYQDMTRSEAETEALRYLMEWFLTFPDGHTELLSTIRNPIRKWEPYNTQNELWWFANEGVIFENGELPVGDYTLTSIWYFDDVIQDPCPLTITFQIIECT